MRAKALINQITHQLKPASSDSKIPAGESTADASVEQKEAINQIFELFRFNYHNQFLKAFPDNHSLLMGKRLWSRLLVEYNGETIMRAAEKAVKECTFLPNVHEVLTRCDRAETLGLPNAHAAYMEACRAPSPKAEFQWSHPAVYYAGRASDWYFLANSTEEKAFPVFQRNYDILLKRLQHGEEIEMEIAKAIPKTIEKPLSREEQKKQLAALMSSLNS